MNGGDILEMRDFIRPMGMADVPRVADIHVFARRMTYYGILPDELLFKKMLIPESMAKISSTLEDKTTESYVYDDSIIKGFITIGPCHDEDNPNAFELWSIYIDPLMQRQGIGTKLLNFWEERAASRGYTEICVRTLDKNTTSRAFYEKMGYTTDGHKKFIESIDAYNIRYSKTLA